MKSQDVLLVLKLVSIELAQLEAYVASLRPTNWWCGWDDGDSAASLTLTPAIWTYQHLASSVGLSTSECHAAVKRSLNNQLLRISRQTERPVPVMKHVEEFCTHGLKYVFPVEVGGLVRGISTTYAAPILEGKLLSSGDYPYVWPDGRGKAVGMALMPIHKSVPQVVKTDPILYELLALIDAMRMGRPREAELAKKIFSQRLQAI